MNSDILKKYTFWHDVDNELSKYIDFSKTSIGEVAEKSTESYFSRTNDNKDLHEYIFQFYAYNELLAAYNKKYNGVIDNNDLTLYEDYQKFLNDFSKRIFSFLLYACTAEAKHSLFISDIDDQKKLTQYKDDLFESFCDDAWSHKDKNVYQYFLEYIEINWDEITIKDFNVNNNAFKSKFNDFVNIHYSIDDIPQHFVEKFNALYYNSDSKVEECVAYFSKHYSYEIEDISRFTQFVKFLHEVKEVGTNTDTGSLQRALIREDTIGISHISHFSTEEYFKYLGVFFLDNFTHGYGGKAWSDISKHALSFCSGEMNIEMFIDRSLSLEHNNGQIFSKNFIFNNDFISNGLYMIYEDKDILHPYIKNIKIQDFILHLQNSSSVLSIGSFLNQDYSNLTKNLDLKTIKKHHSNLNQEHISLFEENFISCKEFAHNIESLKPMLDMAHKLNYTIPAFDYANMCVVIAQKMSHQMGFHNEIAKNIEKSSSYNTIFSEIVQGKYIAQSFKIDNNISQEKQLPAFQLHNLNNLNSKLLDKNLIGGKAFGLIELINKGFNVPKALVFDTKTCLSYLSNKDFFHSQYQKINNKIINYLLDKNHNPLLVSIRSGAPVSMPGMMDSILNVGIDDSSYDSLCSMYGTEVINSCSLSFMHQFCCSKLGIKIDFPNDLDNALKKFSNILSQNNLYCDNTKKFPLSKEEQVKLSVEAVFDSWNSPRAFAWRVEKNISHTMGTAATIQQMVFGNKNDNSFTCVIFSRDCVTGKPDIMGEYLVKAQGEDLVSGKKTPRPISELKTTNPKIYQEIEYIAKSLEEDKKAVQDLEITVEDNQVYVLQMRNAVVSPQAKIALAKELNIDLLDIVEPQHLIGEAKVHTDLQAKYTGLAASPGLISGIIVKDKLDIEKYKESNKPLIFLSNQALPEHAPLLIATQAFITEFGGSTSHAAILARSMNKPCIVGIGKQEIDSGTEITIDASNGKIWEGNLPIVINQSNAINLSNNILKENNIDNNNITSATKVTLKSWIIDFSRLKIVEEKNNISHTMFLNIAQKAALALHVERTKKHKLI